MLLSLHRLAWRLDRGPAPPVDALAPFGSTVEDLKSRLQELRPDLLVFLTTHRRPEAMVRTLEQLEAALRRARSEGLHARVQIVFVDDGSSDAEHAPVAAAAARLFGSDVHPLRTSAALGKRGFWRTHQLFFELAQAARPEHALYLQDDLQFGPELLSECHRLWREAKDSEQRVLYLLRLDEDERWGRWILQPRRPGPLPELERTGWFDLSAFFVDLRFFEQLRFQIFPVPPRRWWLTPSVSSGVGEQLTLRLRFRAHIHQVVKTLVRTGAEPSVMNEAARARRPLSNLEP